VSSKISSIIRIFLRIQRLAQKDASIEYVRKLSRYAEKIYSIPKDVQHVKVTADDIEYEWLIPKNIISSKVLFHIHGGGFVLPLYEPERYTTAYLAKITGTRALLIHYRLAPEYPFPAAIEDCIKAYKYIINEGNISPKKIVFTGESAGGNLVITTLLELRKLGYQLPVGAVAISPVMEFEGKGSFYTQEDPMVHPALAMRQISAYRGKTDPRNPLLSPIYADLSHLPPILLQVGEDELFRSGAETFAETAKRSGVKVTLHIYQGMWHFWHMYIPILPEAKDAMNEINHFASSCN
jgi:monoterpene epsilon-lactone hydrolase